MKSPMLCGHANEVPPSCPCTDAACYCKSNTCAPPVTAPEKLAEFLARNPYMRRLPWGSVHAAGGLVYNTPADVRFHRGELAETALRMLAALGVTADQLEALNAAEDQTAEGLIAALQQLQEGAA